MVMAVSDEMTEDALARVTRENEALRANWRTVTTALGYGDGITEPQIDHAKFVAECERQFSGASEWRESQRWRDECHERAAEASDTVAALRVEVQALREWLPPLRFEQGELLMPAGEPWHEIGVTAGSDGALRTYCTVCSGRASEWLPPDECSQKGRESIPARLVPAARAEAAEAEVVTLRAKVAAVEAVEDSWSGRILPSSAWPHVHHWLRDLRAALATTGEGK